MTTSIYVTFDYLDSRTGAGQVCINEVEALKQVSDVQQVVTRAEIGDRVEPHYGFNPFLFDYFASELIPYGDVDIAHLSCSPANAILRTVKPRHYVVNCPAHNLEESVKEHESITGTKYPFAHNTDPYLSGMLWAHLKNADAVITPSKGSRDWIEDNIHPNRVIVVPHGVDLPMKVNYPDKFTNVGYIGAWGPDKGVKYLIEAWSKLDYDDSTLMFFGREAERMEPFIRHFATGGKYHIHGGFNALEEIMPLFSVYVHPSVSEGYGMSLPEAMAHGRVVVASTGTGSSMNIKDRVNGFLFPPRDVDRLASIIDMLRNDFPSYRGTALEARRTAIDLSWDKIQAQYKKLYEEITC